MPNKTNQDQYDEQSNNLNNEINKAHQLRSDAYNEDGHLMMRAGDVLNSVEEVRRLSRPDIHFYKNNPQPIKHQILYNPEMQKNIANNPGTPDDLTSQLKEKQKIVTAIKNDATQAMASVFGRIASEGNIETSIVQATVKPIIQELVLEQNAFISLTNLKNADEYTFSHSVNVSILAMLLAIKLGNMEYLEDIGITGILHDIGKILSPNNILNKPGPLNQNEIEIMKQHPTTGAGLMIKSGGFNKSVIMGVLDHHEKINGFGYPNRKRGYQISKYGLITSIADVYDALTTDRPYRKALSPRQALTLMTKRMHQSLEPNYLKSFISLIGYYPIGSAVELSNNCKGIVVSNNPENPVIPQLIQLSFDQYGHPFSESIIIDLHNTKDISVKNNEPDLPERDITKIVMNESQEFRAVA